MKMRRFNSTGIEMARQYLAAVKESNDVDNVTLNNQPFARATLISSPSFSSDIPALADLDLDETRQFDTTFAFCEYFDSLIHDHNPQSYREDVGFWTWLAMVYLPQLVKSKANKLYIGEQARLVYSPENYQRQYRHLLAGAFYLFALYRSDPSLCKAVLCHGISVHPELTEQIVSRYDFSHNPAYMAVVKTVYFDDARNMVRKGSGSSGPTAPRHLVRVIDQLAMTRDFYDVKDAERLTGILPKVFRHFCSYKTNQSHSAQPERNI